MIFTFFACFFAVKELNAQKINQFDTNKKRTGVWKKYHTNKRIRYQGAFKNGKEVGVFKFFDRASSKFPIAIKKYDKKSDSVFVQFFNIKGRLQSEGAMLHRKREGNWGYYFPNGKILSTEKYKNGQLEGAVTNYYRKGNITEFTEYKNGLKFGVSRKYSSDNILIEEVHFKNGKLNGLAKYFELNGNLKEKGIYKAGKRFGKWDFYLDGEVASAQEKKSSREKFEKKN